MYRRNHVNACHTRLKRWLRGFNGVSTKCTHDYPLWCIRYDAAGQQSPDAPPSAFVQATARVPVRMWRLTA